MLSSLTIVCNSPTNLSLLLIDCMLFSRTSPSARWQGRYSPKASTCPACACGSNNCVFNCPCASSSSFGRSPWSFRQALPDSELIKYSYIYALFLIDCTIRYYTRSTCGAQFRTQPSTIPSRFVIIGVWIRRTTLYQLHWSILTGTVRHSVCGTTRTISGSTSVACRLTRLSWSNGKLLSNTSISKWFKELMSYNV